jgi:hypothetical protein
MHTAFNLILFASAWAVHTVAAACPWGLRLPLHRHSISPPPLTALYAACTCACCIYADDRLKPRRTKLIVGSVVSTGLQEPMI